MCDTDTKIDPTDPTKPSDFPYNEDNTPFSADWVSVLKWIIDKLFFGSVPSHYLISDAAFVPLESLKFFKIDHNWTDAFLDGALSLANHIDQDFDIVRDAIKKAINRFISPTAEQLGTPHPVPAYGCYIRSTLVTKFPDLIVNTLPQPSESMVLLRHEIVATDTMLCLFSEPPAVATGSATDVAGFQKLIFTQPPHQQTFRAATKITTTTFETDYKRAYTVKNQDDPDRHKNIENSLVWSKGGDNGHPVVYVWDQVDTTTNTTFNIRTLLLDNFATDYVKELTANIPQWFNDPIPTAAVMAFELNNPCYMLEMDIAAKHVLSVLNPTGSSPPPRALPVRGKGIHGPAPEKVSVLGKQLRKPGKKHPSPASRAFREIPLRLAHPPPNHSSVGVGGRLPVIPSIPLPPIRHGSPARQPKFSYNFWSADLPGVPENPGYIPAYTSGLAQDIIFSITLDANSYDYQLRSISISFPMGKPITNPKQNPGPLTCAPYTGPGGQMLSNLRFYPLIRITSDQDVMNITLVPRTSKGQVWVGTCQELSFMLSGVVVNCSDASVGEVNVVVDIKENYVSGTLDPLTRVPYIVLRRTEDDK